MKTRLSAISVVCLWLQAVSASAHHSFVTHYDYDREIVVTGAITSARLANPHSFFTVDVTVEDGSTESWEIEGNSIPLLSRAGITRDTFQVGDIVTVTGMLSRDPARKLMFGFVADTAYGENVPFDSAWLGPARTGYHARKGNGAVPVKSAILRGSGRG